MKNRMLHFTLLIIILLGTYAIYTSNKKEGKQLKNNKDEVLYSGSESCRPCHENFYQLWAPSHHGLAMQPVRAEFLKNEIVEYNQIVEIGSSKFSTIMKDSSLFFVERNEKGDEYEFRAQHVMGGKYVYYFLTELDRGRLQVVPIAYDCKTDTWYNNPESGVRHFETIEDSPLDWQSHLYTFNTSCYGCHVSQLSTNFDTTNFEYNTVWNEPGINCETCHGPSYEHIRVCKKLKEGEVPEDLKIIITGEYSADQHNSACGSCHAKARIVTGSYQPGESFNDYFELITLEDPDFYPDGRDLGENYTMTGWEMNRCKNSSELHCVTCHTSSGRYRFADENINGACMPCHKEKVSNPTAHTFHGEESKASECISCHMPKTAFARMDRTDHSFRPPMPLATIEFNSPNSCNICHHDRSPQWANEQIALTHKRVYQSETINSGRLILQARMNDWTNIDVIVDGLIEGRFDEVYTISFLRLMEQCDSTSKWLAVSKLSDHQSPAVRSAVAHSLYQKNDREAFDILVKLAGDRYRVVRHNAAFSMSRYPPEFMSDDNIMIISSAMKEYESDLVTRHDDWASYYNLANFLSNLGSYSKALNAYRVSMRLYPEAIMPMVNAGYLYSLTGNPVEAEKLFQRALSYSPDHEAALLNLGLLYGETGQTEDAKIYLERLLNVSESNSVAAYNLSILYADDDPSRSLELSEKAYLLENHNPKYCYTYSYFLDQNGKDDDAIRLLTELIKRDSSYVDPYLLMADIMIRNDQKGEAKKLLEKALYIKEIGDAGNQRIRSVLINL